jgi:chondroitin AC lyase
VNKKLLFILFISSLGHFIDKNVFGDSLSMTPLMIEKIQDLIVSGKTLNKKTTLGIAKSITEIGIWEDIDYLHKERAGWKPSEHLKRTKDMATLLHIEDITEEENKLLLSSIFLAIEHWLSKRYTAPNWWHNQIGVPRMMRDITVLMWDRLTEDQLKGMIEVISQFKKIGMTGTNLIWLAEIALHKGMMTHDKALIDEAVERLWKEIKSHGKEGIQKDGSFRQHGERLQTFHYGIGYVDMIVKLAWQLRDTPWAIPQKKKKIISNYLLDGAQWMCRNGFTVPATLDRCVTRKGNLENPTFLIQALTLWKELDPENRVQLEAFIKRLKNEGKPLSGFRHFPRVDFTVFHRPKGSVFLKTVSNRTHLSETMNGEHLKGQPFMNCGDHYIMRNGTEYHELQPVWDWEKLPGLTSAQVMTKAKRMDFVGGLGNGPNGLTTMDYSRSLEDGSHFSIHKTWFFYQDLFICLLSKPKNYAFQQTLETSLEQCHLKGEVRLGQSGKETVLEKGLHHLENIDWILHNNIGYLPLAPSNSMVYIGQRAGNWGSINQRYGKDASQESIFQISIEHESEFPLKGWVVVLDADPQKLNLCSKNPSWIILENNSSLQAINFSEGLTMSSFRGAGSIGLQPDRKLTVDQPCLAIWSHDHLWLNDPTQKGFTMNVHWQKQQHFISLPKGGKSFELSNKSSSETK